MHFASIEYAALLSLVFVLYWAAARHQTLRLLVLGLASYEFYAYWNPVYLALIVGSSGLDFFVGARLHRAHGAGARKAWLTVSLAGNLGLLALFKYFNFFSASVSALAGHLGLQLPALTHQLLLPVGISFYTFQSMSYTIDIYRGELEPIDRLDAFFVFVAFFPQLVAGPIVRARQFLPQLAQPPRLEPEASGRAFYLIGLGLLKKAVIADLLAVNLVDRIFETPARYTAAELLAGVYGYAVQIYCDFSAYSDIAIGSALLLGLKLPRNFDQPYRAANLREFWRRWHISLSTWLRDYLYISLGGSRGGAFRTYRNLALTMLLGGLWHGAAWTFVVWGALHGVGLALTRAWQRWRGRERASLAPGGSGAASGSLLGRALAVLLTFHFVCLAWIFFRAESFDRALEIITGLASFSGGTANVSRLLWLLLALGLATQLFPPRASVWLRERFARAPAPLQALALFAAILLLRYAGTTDVVPFIYFQF